MFYQHSSKEIVILDMHGFGTIQYYDMIITNETRQHNTQFFDKYIFSNYRTKQVKDTVF